MIAQIEKRLNQRSRAYQVTGNADKLRVIATARYWVQFCYGRNDQATANVVRAKILPILHMLTPHPRSAHYNSWTLFIHSLNAELNKMQDCPDFLGTKEASGATPEAIF